ncbi:metal-binding protein [Hathewaya limosa]|uniref:Metal-binding protein n=1 Tax=Hathewaya limosa TaxID=1536 RepID=A0ABU0JMJ3_HATLI|nr:metal-binding protein [Hathewaya limosa]MDQ0478307.1 hypothetical protein [Hathewaya limosa]
MISKETMLYIESEYSIINSTPCEFCGSNLIIDELYVEFIEGYPHHLCICTCSKCGNEKVFAFSAPYFRNEELILPSKFFTN